MTAAALLFAATVAAPNQSLSILMPHTLPAGEREVSVACRDSRAGWIAAVEWREMAGPSFSVQAAVAGRCRVLVRPLGATSYLASAEAVLGRSTPAISIDSQWLRTVDAPPSGGEVRWLGANGNDDVECVALADRSRCWFVPAASAGAIVSHSASRLLFALVPPGELQWAGAWRTAVWARLVRVRAPSEVVTADIISLHASLKHGSGRMREARPASGVAISRLAPAAFWLAGTIAPESYLELRSDGAATTRVPLATISSPDAAAIDVALVHHVVITGEVRGPGSIAEGATVMIARILDTPGSAKVPDRERPLERVAETVVGPSGEFRFESLGAGQYELLAVHPSRGRASAIVSPPAHTRLLLRPRATIRGQVLRNGIPVRGAVVRALPSIDAVTAARNPAALGAEAVRSGATGRFEVIAPDEGRVTLSISAEEGAFRLELGAAESLAEVTDVGEVRLDDPLEVEIVVELPGGCDVRAAGPMGAVGLTAIRAAAIAQGRWVLRPPHAGRWLLAGVCQAHELALDPAVIQIPPARHGPIFLKVRR